MYKEAMGKGHETGQGDCGVLKSILQKRYRKDGSKLAILGPGAGMKADPSSGPMIIPPIFYGPSSQSTFTTTIPPCYLRLESPSLDR